MKGTSLELDGVSVQYGNTTALEAVSLSISAGERVGLVGPSGSGKTTLLRLLNGSVLPDQGDVHVSGSPLYTLSRTDLRRVRASIGFVYQDHRLVPNLQVSQNVIAGQLGRVSLLKSLRMMLFPSRVMVEKAHEILCRVGIGEKLFERTDHLSGGQQQRVAIARALFQEPQVLLADEPVSSVDPARAKDAVELLTRISREENLTLVMSLHNLDLAREYCERLIGLRRGRIVFDEPTSSIQESHFSELYRIGEGEMLADGA